ncbi:MAG: hypothetical protein RLZZ511_672 [Cyanobacteriota bacterium]|jgi:type III pantothenate kinase
MVIQINAQSWLALAIGNSRNHWARFVNHQLVETWHTPHLTEPPSTSNSPTPNCPIVLASVVPAQTQFWQALSNPPPILQLSDIPIGNVYPTLGIDRALALWGAIVTYGAPVLVIDSGTALTLTGADAEHNLFGGAIFPGVGLLYRTLHRSTAALPVIQAPESMTDRWANDTHNAIHSGITHFLGAGLGNFIQDWQQQFPGSPIVFTGGDGERLQDWYRLINAPIGDSSVAYWPTRVDPDLIFRGMQALVSTESSPGCPTAGPN